MAVNYKGRRAKRRKKSAEVSLERALIRCGVHFAKWCYIRVLYPHTIIKKRKNTIHIDTYYRTRITAKPNVERRDFLFVLVAKDQLPIMFRVPFDVAVKYKSITINPKKLEENWIYNYEYVPKVYPDTSDCIKKPEIRKSKTSLSIFGDADTDALLLV